MLQNAYLLAKIGADTAEHEQHSVQILSTFRVSERPRRRGAQRTRGGTGAEAQRLKVGVSSLWSVFRARATRTTMTPVQLSGG